MEINIQKSIEQIQLIEAKATQAFPYQVVLSDHSESTPLNTAEDEQQQTLKHKELAGSAGHIQ